MAKGSAADTAGLRDGDEIVDYTDYLEVLKTPDGIMKLTIRRGDGERRIEYLPRGDFIDAYEWERVTTVPDAKCRI